MATVTSDPAALRQYSGRDDTLLVVHLQPRAPRTFTVPGEPDAGPLPGILLEVRLQSLPASLDESAREIDGPASPYAVAGLTATYRKGGITQSVPWYADTAIHIIFAHDTHAPVFKWVTFAYNPEYRADDEAILQDILTTFRFDAPR